MKRSFFVVLLLIGLSSNHSFADDGDKLDAILHELQQLRLRVEAMEKKLDQLTPTTVKVISIEDTVPYQKRRTIPVYRRRHTEVEEVFRMQFEKSDDLFEDVHEREQRLRKRLFVPEVFSP